MAKEPFSCTWAFNLHDESSGIKRSLASGISARIYPGDHAMVSVVRFDPNSIGTIHSHSEEQWGFLLKGECLRIQGDESVCMKAGDFWHTPGGVPHAIHAGSTGAIVLDVFSPPRPEYSQPGEGFGE
jgi:quercetin dioxygenase-like cupin family protein